MNKCKKTGRGFFSKPYREIIACRILVELYKHIMCYKFRIFQSSSIFQNVQVPTFYISLVT